MEAIDEYFQVEITEEEEEEQHANTTY